MSDDNDVVMVPSMIMLSNGDELMGIASVMKDDGQIAIFDPLRVVRHVDMNTNSQSHMLYRWVMYSDDRIYFVPLHQVVTICNLSKNNISTYDKARKSFYMDVDNNQIEDESEDEEPRVEPSTKKILH